MVGMANMQSVLAPEPLRQLGNSPALVVWSTDEFNLKRRLSHENLSHENPKGNDQMDIISISFLFSRVLRFPNQLGADSKIW